LFLHIGNNILLKKEEIVGVFSVDSLQKDAKGKKFLNELKQGDNVHDISDGKWVSVVLTDDGVYITRISSSTLMQRSGKGLKEMLRAEEASGPPKAT